MNIIYIPLRFTLLPCIILYTYTYVDFVCIDKINESLTITMFCIFICSSGLQMPQSEYKLCTGSQ